MKRRKRWQPQDPTRARPDVEPAGPARSRTRAAAERDARGERLAPETRQEMERLLGEDFAEVRIHRDPEAAEAAAAVGARAYARGRDLYFGKNRYDPDSPAGRETLAHELAHVVQTGGRAAQSERLEPAASHLEQEAHAVAARARSGEPTKVLGNATATGLLRQAEEEPEATPRTLRHSREITPAQGRGTINAGSFSVNFRYEMAEGASESTLVLEIPDGVQAMFAPVGELAAGDYRSDDPGGDAARTVKLYVRTETGGLPRVRATFSNSAVNYVAIFQFPG